MKDSRVSRRDFVGATGAAMLGNLILHPADMHASSSVEATSSRRVGPQAGSRMNLILFMPDELRADALACYGNPLVRTPNFDRLAKAGTRFEQCHIAYPICGASRCSLLTGWPVSVRGHRSQQYYLRPEEPNLFRYLREGGYDVFWFGKNDALAPETFHDSVTAWNFLDGNSLQTGNGGGRGAGRPPGPLTFLNEEAAKTDRRKTGDYKYVQAGIRMLERKEADRPFCLFLPLTSPHPPYTAPEDFSHMYSPADVTGLIPPDIERRPRYMERMRAAYGLDNVSNDLFMKIRAEYLGKVSYSDWLLGELLDAVERTGRDKDTAIFVLSDHGDYAGDFGLVEKWPSGLEDCLTHVPLIAKAPHGTAGHVVHEQTEQFDVMATCLDLAGIQATHTHFARSLRPQIEGANGDAARGSFSEGGYNIYEPQCFEPVPAEDTLYYPRLHLHHTEPETVSRAAAVKTAEYKLVSRPQGDSEFYILRSDPRQLHNCYGDASVRDAQAEAERRLLHWYVNTTGISPRGADARGFPPYIPLATFPPDESKEQILDRG